MLPRNCFSSESVMTSVREWMLMARCHKHLALPCRLFWVLKSINLIIYIQFETTTIALCSLLLILIRLQFDVWKIESIDNYLSSRYLSCDWVLGRWMESSGTQQLCHLPLKAKFWISINLINCSINEEKIKNCRNFDKKHCFFNRNSKTANDCAMHFRCWYPRALGGYHLLNSEKYIQGNHR